MGSDNFADIDLNPRDLSQAAKRTDEMGFRELGRYIRKVEREGYGAVRYRVDFHSKLAAPFVCVFLSTVSIPNIYIKQNKSSESKSK